MNKKITMKLAMYESVHETLKGKQSLLESSPALTNAVNKLEIEINKLKDVNYKQSNDITWITARKNNLCDELVTKAFRINKVLIAYALSNGLTDVVNQLSVSQSSFMKGGIQGKLTRVKNLLDVLPAHLPGLASYTVSQANFTELESMFNELDAFVRAPRLAISNKTVMTSNLSAITRKIDHFLAFEMDAILLNLESLDKETFSQYKAARKLVNYRGKHKDAGKSITDINNGSFD